VLNISFRLNIEQGLLTGFFQEPVNSIKHLLWICYAKLSKGGKAEHPPQNTFWGALFGDLTDKYGNHWLLNFDQTKK